MIADKIIPRDSHEQGQKWNFLRRCRSSKGFLVICPKRLRIQPSVCVQIYTHTCICTYGHTHIRRDISIVYLTDKWGQIYMRNKIFTAQRISDDLFSFLSCVPSFRWIHSTSGCVWQKCLSLSWGFRPLLIGLHLGKLTDPFDSYGIFQFHLFLSTSLYVTMQFWIALIKLDLIWKYLQ